VILAVSLIKALQETNNSVFIGTKLLKWHAGKVSMAAVVAMILKYVCFFFVCRDIMLYST
jgi:hypothetical protein